MGSYVMKFMLHVQTYMLSDWNVPHNGSITMHTYMQTYILHLLKNRIYFVLEDKLLPGSNLASSDLRKTLV